MSLCRRVPIGFALVCALASCEKKNASPAAPAPVGLPPLDEKTLREIHPGPGSVHPPTGETGAQALPPGHPAIADDSMAVGAADKPDPNAVIQGVLKVDSKLRAKATAGDVIFVIARAASEGEAPGQLLAVKKLTVGAWPLPFVLDGADVMLQGTKLKGKVVVTARLDKDGDAMSKNPGDLVGSSEPVTVPASGVVVTLDKAL